MIQKLKILWYQKHDLWHWYKIHKKFNSISKLKTERSYIALAIESTLGNTVRYCCYYEESTNAN